MIYGALFQWTRPTVGGGTDVPNGPEPSHAAARAVRRSGLWQDSAPLRCRPQWQSMARRHVRANSEVGMRRYS